MRSNDQKWIIKQIDQTKEKLMVEIRREGVLRERSQDDIERLREGYESLRYQLQQIAERLTKLENDTYDYFILRELVKKHSLQIQELKKN